MPVQNLAALLNELASQSNEGNNVESNALLSQPPLVHHNATWVQNVNANAAHQNVNNAANIQVNFSFLNLPTFSPSL
jgi:hypothetical protein